MCTLLDIIKARMHTCFAFNPPYAIPDNLVEFNALTHSFGYTFWLRYTMTYSKVRSSSILN